MNVLICISPTICVSVPMMELDFQRHMLSVCVQWVQLRWEVIVRFVDIGGIDEHDCWNFPFITLHFKSNLVCHMSFALQRTVNYHA